MQEMGCASVQDAKSALDLMPRAFLCSADNFYAYRTYFTKIGKFHYFTVFVAMA